MTQLQAPLNPRMPSSPIRRQSTYMQLPNSLFSCRPFSMWSGRAISFFGCRSSVVSAHPSRLPQPACTINFLVYTPHCATSSSYPAAPAHALALAPLVFKPPAGRLTLLSLLCHSYRCPINAHKSVRILTLTDTRIDQQGSDHRRKAL